MRKIFLRHSRLDLIKIQIVFVYLFSVKYDPSLEYQMIAFLNAIVDEPKKIKPARIGFCCLLPLLLLGVLFGLLIHFYEQYAIDQQAKIQSNANAQKKESTSKIYIPANDMGDPYEDHPETNAVVAANKTKWGTYKNYSFKYQFAFPVNTSYLMKNSDNSEIWLLRQTGYLFKVTAYPYVSQAPIDWVKTLPNYSEFTVSQGIFAKQSSVILTSIDTTSSTSGSEYVFSYKGNMIIVWHKNTTTMQQNPDDVKRLQGVLQSFTLL